MLLITGTRSRACCRNRSLLRRIVVVAKSWPTGVRRTSASATSANPSSTAASSNTSRSSTSSCRRSASGGCRGARRPEAVRARRVSGARRQAGGPRRDGRRRTDPRLPWRPTWRAWRGTTAVAWWRADQGDGPDADPWDRRSDRHAHFPTPGPPRPSAGATSGCRVRGFPVAAWEPLGLRPP
jgi:hypothetical protein